MMLALSLEKRRRIIYTRTSQIVIDGSIFAFSFAAANLIRFEGLPDWPVTQQFLLLLLPLIGARLLIHWRLGIYRFIWRFTSLSDALSTGGSLSVVTLLLLGLRIFYPAEFFASHWIRLPLSVIVLEFLLSLTGSLGVRALRRVFYERTRAGLVPCKKAKRVILYGAGRAGMMLLKELRIAGGVDVVGFVDDDPQKTGAIILGTKVLCRGESLAEIIRQYRPDEVVISIATASRKSLTQILTRCNQSSIPAKIVPSLHEIIEGKVSISEVRDIHVDDLLGRSRIEVGEVNGGLRQAYSGKRILVTGAGGSIGSELVRQLLPLNPETVIILDKDENSIYELEQELVFTCPSANIDAHIMDLRFPERLSPLFAEREPQVVFHAAAHKHVPLMEKQPCEAVLNNVCGTRNLLDASCDNGVERFLFISTDKAVKPTNVMGATKRVGEMLVQTYAIRRHLRSACVRFGNVIGSRGSVIPLFRKQIAMGGPVTVTHPEVDRFFMTITEAVQLILCAGTLADQGEVFVLDMGSPRRILELAHQMVRMSGFEPEKDIEIAITGLRPGEKLSEELVGTGEALCGTRFPKLSRITCGEFGYDLFFEGIASLAKAAVTNDHDAVYTILSHMGLGFRPQSGRIPATPAGVLGPLPGRRSNSLQPEDLPWKTTEHRSRLEAYFKGSSAG